ncbi:MAG: hypothetical protein U0229_26385 [Anaeromyxobacter sp.]
MQKTVLAASLAIAGAGALALAVGCNRSEAAPAVAAAPAAAPAHAGGAPAAAGKKLLFFQNPNGQPCQLQEGILAQMPDLAARAEVVRVMTTEPAHMRVFEAYGIRALPTLVVVDATGRELRRGTPGVQSDAAVRALLAD